MLRTDYDTPTVIESSKLIIRVGVDKKNIHLDLLVTYKASHSLHLVIVTLTSHWFKPDRHYKPIIVVIC